MKNIRISNSKTGGRWMRVMGATIAALAACSTALATSEHPSGVDAVAVTMSVGANPQHSSRVDPASMMAADRANEGAAETRRNVPSISKRTTGWWAANAWWWWNSAGGWTLSVTPTGLAQSVGTAAAGRVWNDALAIAGTRPFSPQVYASLYEQLQCHLWYTFKTPYNLDSWRPQVAWWYELYTRCNP
jgi:Protein of unknown function (DUF2599)